MRPTIDTIPQELTRASTPAFIASLIESAANVFEVDLVASRDYLFQAYRLLRAQSQRAEHSNTPPTRGQLATWQTRRIIAYIDKNLEGELPAHDLARFAGLSIGHFFRAFKKSVGATPRDYITRRRIEVACELMSNTSETLSQIALACGLNDQSSFCRVFRRIVGQRPSEWRRAKAIEPQRAASP